MASAGPNAVGPGSDLDEQRVARNFSKISVCWVMVTRYVGVASARHRAHFARIRLISATVDAGPACPAGRTNVDQGARAHDFGADHTDPDRFGARDFRAGVGRPVEGGERVRPGIAAVRSAALPAVPAEVVRVGVAAQCAARSPPLHRRGPLSGAQARHRPSRGPRHLPLPRLVRRQTATATPTSRSRSPSTSRVGRYTVYVQIGVGNQDVPHPRHPRLTEDSPESARPDPFAGPAWADSRGRVRVRRRRRRRRRRRIVLGGAGLLVLLVLAGAWLAWNALHARSQLQLVRADVQRLQSQIASGDLAGARDTISSLRSHATAAQSYVDSPIWRVGESVPFLGSRLTSARSLTTIIDQISNDAMPRLVDAASVLTPAKLREANGSIDLAAIEHVAPELAARRQHSPAQSTTCSTCRRRAGRASRAREPSCSTQLPSLGKTIGTAQGGGPDRARRCSARRGRGRT